ncbi:helix-turn-helix domain-containing protein [uncultured Fusobacterium sp.]|uniref:helix-turn-helix domain-containing protein n=1 Tax=uncultured Fusobacterium sp. TaxID=159267 RepID=UPI0015A664C7|nr:helix-turn-helix transcriptional regulator [uncultured Fusobacterium sp.]
MYKFEIDINKRKELGQYIKKLRVERELTLIEICKKSQVSLSDLHKIENGTKLKINPFQLKALGNILKVDYKIFYKICGFIEDKDYSNNLLKNESIYSKQELINDLNIYYKNFDLITLLSSLEKLKKSEINEVLLFIDFIKIRNEKLGEKNEK